MIMRVRNTARANAIALCLIGGALAGCSSLNTGPLALSDTSVGTRSGSAPAILPAAKPTRATDVKLALRGTLNTRFGSEVLALAADDEQDESNFITDVNDPLQPLNRGFHMINRGVDFAIMRPVTAIYNSVLPKPLRRGVRNGLRHIALPAQMVNYALQGEGEQAGNTIARFLVNSIAGFGGLADPASKREELEYKPTDFGITLGKWGVGEGIYFEAPLMGPTTTRASVGRIVDIALSPLTYITFASDFGTFTAYDAIAPSVKALELVDMRARNADLVDEVLYSSPDTYITLRTVYLQDRRNKLTGGEVTASNLPTILEFRASTR